MHLLATSEGPSLEEQGKEFFLNTCDIDDEENAIASRAALANLINENKISIDLQRAILVNIPNGKKLSETLNIAKVKKKLTEWNNLTYTQKQ